MKKVKWSVAVIALVAVTSAFATKKQTYNRKHEVTGEGGSGAGVYWTIGTNVTGQQPDQPNTYECNGAGNCTVELNSADIFSGNRVLKSAAAAPQPGTFNDLP